jgi:hypothetical protein
MKPTTRTYDEWIGRTAVDSDGNKIGEIKDIYYDDVSGRPEWVEVSTGMTSRGIAPINGAAIREHDDDDADQDLMLAVTKAQIKDAPNVDKADSHLSVQDEQDLYRHYGFDWGNRSDKDFGYGKDKWAAPRFDKDYDRSKLGAVGNVGVEDRGTVEAEATIRNQDVNVTQSTEKVRLRKIQRTEMVPVTKEEVVVERTSDDTTPGSVRRS